MFLPTPVLVAEEIIVVPGLHLFPFPLDLLLPLPLLKLFLVPDLSLPELQVLLLLLVLEVLLGTFLHLDHIRCILLRVHLFPFSQNLLLFFSFFNFFFDSHLLPQLGQVL